MPQFRTDIFRPHQRSCWIDEDSVRGDVMKRGASMRKTILFDDVDAGAFRTDIILRINSLCWTFSVALPIVVRKKVCTHNLATLASEPAGSAGAGTKHDE
jgi:hypothetical protein